MEAFAPWIAFFVSSSETGSRRASLPVERMDIVEMLTARALPSSFHFLPIVQADACLPAGTETGGGGSMPMIME